MSRDPRFSLFRPWMDLSSSGKTNGDRPRPVSLSDEDERRLNIKLAVFFTVVALLFVLAEHLGRVQEQTNAKLAPDSMAFVSLTLLPMDRSGNGVDFSVRFRLSNMGNHSVFYPFSTTTNEPIGELAVRTSPSADWTTLSGPSKERLPALQNAGESNLRWIEIPPGGWVDGEFSDTGDWTGEHAYAIFLKPSRNAGTVQILSEPYGSGRK